MEKKKRKKKTDKNINIEKQNSLKPILAIGDKLLRDKINATFPHWFFPEHKTTDWLGKW